jgi:hypothetical protein
MMRSWVEQAVGDLWRQNRVGVSSGCICLVDERLVGSGRRRKGQKIEVRRTCAETSGTQQNSWTGILYSVWAEGRAFAQLKFFFFFAGNNSSWLTCN